MSFYVEPGAVSGLVLLVLRNAEGMHGHHELICRSAPNDWSEGILLNLIAPKLDEMQEQAKRDTGRAEITSNVLSDGFMDTPRAAVEKWHELPDGDRDERVGGADTAMRERITHLAELAVEDQKVRSRRPEPPDDELYEQPVIILPDEPWRPVDRG